MKCERVGCDNRATVLMGQDSPWRMLFSPPDFQANLCEKDALEAEELGGVRLNESDADAP